MRGGIALHVDSGGGCECVLAVLCGLEVARSSAWCCSVGELVYGTLAGVIRALFVPFCLVVGGA